MSALDVIRQVQLLGGKLVLEDKQLKLQSPNPLPQDLVQAVTKERSAIMVALGAPLDDVVSGILVDVRPYLPSALRRLPDDRLLALVNWSIMAAWEKALRRLNEQ